MADSILKPESVSFEDARKILDAINKITTIDGMIELLNAPGESDLGTGIAKRILSAKDKLGGFFTDLKQIDQIPLIGPERFSDIVRVVLEKTNVSSQPFNQDQFLAQEIVRLSAQVAALAKGSTSSSVSLTCTPSYAFLGQSITVKIQVRTVGENTPLVNEPVIVFASGGQLQPSNAPDSGNCYFTDCNGTVNVTFLPATSEELLYEHWSALETFFYQLSADTLATPSPQSILDKLVSLAESYYWPINVELREAIDILNKTFGSGIDTAVFRSGCLDRWRVNDTLITAAHIDALTIQNNCGPVKSSSAYLIKLVNWLEPFFYCLTNVVASKNTLSSDFASNIKNGVHGTDIVQGIYSQADSFIRNGRGQAGSYLSKQEAGSAMRKFFTQNAKTLDPSDQLQLMETVAQSAAQLEQIDRTSLYIKELSARTNTQFELHLRDNVMQQISGSVTSNVLSALASQEAQIQINQIVVSQINSTLETQIKPAVSTMVSQEVNTIVETAFDSKINKTITEKLDAYTNNTLNAQIENYIKNRAP